jgi:hypothetical protein
MIANQERLNRSNAAVAAARFIRNRVLDALLVMRLVTASILLLLKPIIGFILCALAVILAIVSVVIKFSGDAPKFPFWGALGLAAGLFLLFILYTWVVELIAPKVKE